MGNSPLSCWRWRNSQPAPLPSASFSEDFLQGAIKVEWSGSPHVDWEDSSYVEWANGYAEFCLETGDCREGEAFGIHIRRFTCMTAVHRLYMMARRHGMGIIWESVIVPDAPLIKHYKDDALSDGLVEVASSFDQLRKIMSVSFVNCPEEADDVA